MAESDRRHVVCTACFVGQDAQVERSILGVSTFHCLACGARCETPLSTPYRVVYGCLAAVLLVPITLESIRRESYGVCGVFWSGAIVALAADCRVRRKVRRAEANERVQASDLAERFR